MILGRRAAGNKLYLRKAWAALPGLFVEREREGRGGEGRRDWKGRKGRPLLSNEAKALGSEVSSCPIGGRAAVFPGPFQ
jgi:hypothetical protein